MSVISVDTFASYLGVDNAEPGLLFHLEKAEGLTAAKLGTATLEARVGIVERTRYDLNYDKVGLSGGYQSIYKHLLQSGPATSLTSITVNGTDVTPDSSLSDTGWSVTFPPVYRSIAFDNTSYSNALFSERFIADLVVTYDAGYTEATLPDAIKMYILTKGALFYAIPIGGLSRAIIGDSQVHLSIDMLRESNSEYELLLNRYRRIPV